MVNENDPADEDAKSSDALLAELVIKTQEVNRERDGLVELRKALEKERSTLENEKKRYKLETEEFYSKQNTWEKDFKKKKESIELIERNLNKIKSKIDMERQGIDIDLKRLGSERGMLEEENDIINSKRDMLEEERKTIDRERKLLNEREEKFAAMRRQLRSAADTVPSMESLSAESLSEDIDFSRDMPEPLMKTAEKPRKPPKPKKKGKTMPCLKCGAEVTIPDGAEKAVCSICGKEYTIRGSARPARGKPAAAASPEIPELLKSKTRRRELSDGRLEVICENRQCENKFIVDDPTARRVHCPVCGRRVRLQ